MFANLKKPVFSEKPAFQLPEIDENLVHIGGDLSVPSLLRAYKGGSFPWTVHPVTWWSPDPRAILDLSTFRPPRSLAKFLRKNPFEFTTDRAFDKVIDHAAASVANRRSTWITAEFQNAYKELHRAGHAHSVETWQNGVLVGGIYGVSIGGYFAGESMFHRVSNASKAALCQLVEHLRARGYALFDVQMPTRITLQLGAQLLPRREFLLRLRAAQALDVSFGPRGQTEK
jgi:leucyl/phenylalanyl-tRNA---protein transferase